MIAIHAQDAGPAADGPVPTASPRASADNVLLAQTKAFEAYVEAQARAKASLRFEDARAAGLAWGRFLELYVAASPSAGDAG